MSFSQTAGGLNVTADQHIILMTSFHRTFFRAGVLEQQKES